MSLLLAVPGVPSLPWVLSFLLVPFDLAQDESTPTERPHGIVAIVNWEAITRLELEKALGPVAEAIRDQVPPEHHDTFMAQQRTRVLNALIRDRLLLQACDELKIEATDEHLERYLELHVIPEARERGLQIQNGSEYFRKRREETGEQIKEIREELLKEIRIRLLFEQKVFQDPYISPRELQEYYKANPGQFSTNPTYIFRHIFIPRSVIDIGERNQAVQEGIAEGLDFATLVEKYSEGPRRDEGGRWKLDDDRLDGYLAPMREVRRMVVGETSGPHQSAEGIHYVFLEDRVAGRQLKFEEAQKQIEKQIKQERRQRQGLRYEKELRQKAHVRIYLDDKAAGEEGVRGG